MEEGHKEDRQWRAESGIMSCDERHTKSLPSREMAGFHFSRKGSLWKTLHGSDGDQFVGVFAQTDLLCILDLSAPGGVLK